MEDVCILIPTLNEEKTIKEIISEFKSQGFNNILVMDGNSTDKTREIAEATGARVVVQTGKGKGQAIIQAFKIIKAPYIVMIDGDGTYLPSEVNRLLKPLLRGEADHVIGNRMSSFEKGAFTRLNLLGNRILNKLFGFAYGVWLQDILSGYRAFNRKAIENFDLKHPGFEVEAEITVESVKKDLKIAEVPVSYLSRQLGAATKLHPLRDGLRIGYTIYHLARTHNPLFYFSLIGLGFLIAGIILGIYVVNEWLKNITHVPLTILTTLLIIMGIQMFIFALLSDLIVSLHRETLREIRKAMKGKGED